MENRALPQPITKDRYLAVLESGPTGEVERSNGEYANESTTCEKVIQGSLLNVLARERPSSNYSQKQTVSREIQKENCVK